MPIFTHLIKTTNLLFEPFISILKRHSLFMLSAAIIITYAGKKIWYNNQINQTSLLPGEVYQNFISLISSDLIFYSLIGVFIWVIEFFFKTKKTYFLTALIAFPVSAMALLNFFWLIKTGDQLSIPVLQVGIKRFSEIFPIIKSGLGTSGLIIIPLSFTLFIFIPFIFQKINLLKQNSNKNTPIATLILLLILLLTGITTSLCPDSNNARKWANSSAMSLNFNIGFIKNILNSNKLTPVDFSKKTPSLPASHIDKAKLPNIIFVTLEATALRATSLNDKGIGYTPFLKQLSIEGLSILNMRAVIPHTSKSNFSMLCGRYPSMQQDILETANNYPMKCVPEILNSFGYETAWFQTADGRFEGRARFVKNAGYKYFEALQSLSPEVEKLGYLAGDDQGAVIPIINFASKSENPFFIQLMTSATHHPYEIPSRVQDSKIKNSKNTKDQLKRYLKLVTLADESLKQLITELEKISRKSKRELIVIATGDHGEAFGEHGGFQHDNIYFEEGLHVPFVVWSSKRDFSVNTPDNSNHSLIDTAPTILHLAGIPYNKNLFDGRSILDKPDKTVTRYFSCWYSDMCAGYVKNNIKIVYIPFVESWHVYDLKKDPGEMHPSVEPEEYKDDADKIKRWYSSHKHSDKGLIWNNNLYYNKLWQCKKDTQRCRYMKKSK